ncbi:MAG: cob(I)yrinic acid a,c-diamide adenosyltransferase [Patescibacteria group bacterium]
MADSFRKHGNGIVIVYFGDGKGKTTAALGLAMRALGRGMDVAVLQFIKSEPGTGKGITWSSGERIFAETYSKSKIQNPKSKMKVSCGQLFIKTLGEGFVRIRGDKRPFEEHRRAARKGLHEAEKMLRAGRFQVVILDEVLRAIEEKLLTVNSVVSVLKNKKRDVHVVLTGHHVPKEILAVADLVTEMRKVKHPFDVGILAKIGIDY